MDGGLSQDEINALLSGMSLSDDESGMDGNSGVEEAASEGQVLSDMDKDAIGEVGNISMGSSATTLYSLVNKKVNITTPVVELIRWDDLMGQYERPCVFIQIKYTVGLDGTNILILKEHDVKVITDLMMGGDGSNTEDELSELHLSAISEAMNQMMGAAATSLSTMLGQKIDISPPEATLLDLNLVKDGSDISDFLGSTFVKISFRMQIGDDDDILVDSSIMQLYPVEFARNVVDIFMGSQTGADGASKEEAAPAQNTGAAPGPQTEMSGQAMNGQAAGFGMDPQMMNMGMNPQGMNGYGANPQMMNMGMNPQAMGGPGMNPQMMNMGMNGYGMNPQMMNMGMNAYGMNPQMGMQNVNVQAAQFQSFTNDGRGIPGQENIGLIMDVPLNVTVELGRTSKSISEILDFAPGSIIDLERIAGEPIDVLVNGKLVAKGEVVVIEECFSVRITEIIK